MRPSPGAPAASEHFTESARARRCLPSDAPATSSTTLPRRAPGSRPRGVCSGGSPAGRLVSAPVVGKKNDTLPGPGRTPASTHQATREGSDRFVEADHHRPGRRGEHRPAPGPDPLAVSIELDDGEPANTLGERAPATWRIEPALRKAAAPQPVLRGHHGATSTASLAHRFRRAAGASGDSSTVLAPSPGTPARTTSMRSR